MDERMLTLRQCRAIYRRAQEAIRRSGKTGFWNSIYQDSPWSFANYWLDEIENRAREKKDAS